MSMHLRFAPDVLKRLGEELNPSPEQGILELVRNAYDADASRCAVKLSAVAKKGGTLTIEDDGKGMDPEQLRTAWLVLGRSPKAAHERTERFGRLTVGSKGLGRLAALRLGSVAHLRTRPAATPGVEYRLAFDWARFASAETIDAVPLDVETCATTLPAGTTIVVSNLERPLTKNEVTRLARALVLLATPFESGGSFRPRLSAPEFHDLEQLVRTGYWDQAAYEIRAELGPDGRASGSMTDNEHGGRLVAAEHESIRGAAGKPPYAAPPAQFEFWVFRLSGDTGTRGRTAAGSVAALREWLGVIGGVHLYHRGLRVYPYGDPGHDWLDMNLHRAASPEERPSTNNSVGRVTVLDEDAVLQQKTDRSGFIETIQFEDLRSFAQDVLEWVARVRLKEAEGRRRSERSRARGSLATAQVQMREAIATSPPTTRATLEVAERQVQQAIAREVLTLTSDLDLYRTLATIGTTTAVMAHESFNPPNTIIKLAISLRRRARRLLGEDYPRIGEQVDLIESNARRMATLVSLPRRLLDRGKRRRGTFSVNDVVGGTIDLLKPLIDEHRIRVDQLLDANHPRYVGTIAAMESVVTNLVINAISALDGYPGNERLIRVQTASDGRDLLIDIADNGPGIRNIDVEDIWLPGRGTTSRGVGLGLTIVRDIVADLDGSTVAHSQGELGGAQFTIRVPLAAD
jgi:signal transduction histidine kinase